MRTSHMLEQLMEALRCLGLAQVGAAYGLSFVTA